MANENVIQAILEQARAYGSSGREGYIFRGATFGAQGLSKGIAGFARNMRIQGEIAQTEQDIQKMDTLVGQGASAEDIMSAATTPASQEYGRNMLAAGIAERREVREEAQSRAARAESDARLDLLRKGATLKERQLTLAEEEAVGRKQYRESQLALEERRVAVAEGRLEAEQAPEPVKPFGTGIDRIIDKDAKGLKLSPVEQKRLDAYVADLERSQREPVRLTLPDTFVEDLGLDPDQTYTVEEALDLARAQAEFAAETEGEEEETRQRRTAEGLATFLNNLAEKNGLDIPPISPETMENRSTQAAIVNTISNAISEKRRTEAAEDLAAYRTRRLELQNFGLDLRKQEFNLKINSVQDEAAQGEIREVLEILDNRESMINMVDPNNSVEDLLKKHPDLWQRYQRALAAGSEARGRLMETPSLVPTEGAPEKGAEEGEGKGSPVRDDEYYRKILGR